MCGVDVGNVVIIWCGVFESNSVCGEYICEWCECMCMLVYQCVVWKYMFSYISFFNIYTYYGHAAFYLLLLSVY